MAPQAERWSLGAKLALVGVPFLLLGFLAAALTLWASWQLDGGAAAVNEAGRMRMQAYRLAWNAGLQAPPAEHAALVQRMDQSMSLLAEGDLGVRVPPDDIVLIDQDKCRGWRMCVSGCPYKTIHYNWKSGKA